MSCIECSIIVKDENKKLVNKYLLYDGLALEPQGTLLEKMVKETVEQFKIDAHSERPSIIIKTSMMYQ